MPEKNQLVLCLYRTQREAGEARFAKQGLMVTRIKENQ